MLAFYDYAEFESYRFLLSEAEIAQRREATRFERGEDGKVYQFNRYNYDNPERVYLMDATPLPPIAEQTAFSLEVLGCPLTHTVNYAVTNLLPGTQALPAYFRWDVLLGGTWYLICSTDEADNAYADSTLHMPEQMDPLAPGETRTLDMWCMHYQGLLPGHYRMGLALDPQQGWVIEEFDITEDDLTAWEAQWE